MRAKHLLRPCVMLIFAAPLTAAIAQSRPCSTVPPAARELARAIGACDDVAPIIDVAAKAPGPEVPVVVLVPNVVGLSFDDARARLARFELQRSYRASGEPGGTVLAQEPAPPARVAPGTPVRLVLSDGTLRPAPRVADSEIDGVRRPPEARAPQEVPAPQEAVIAPPPNATVAQRGTAEARNAPVNRVAGAQRGTPQSKASANRARVERTSVPKAPVAAAPPGNPSDAGAAVATPVPETFELPNVIGRSSTEANAALAEFKVDQVEVVANAAPSGEVLAQDPAPGTPVAPGSAIGLQVSDGSLAQAAVPPPVAAPGPTVAPPRVQSTRAPITFPSNAVLLLIAGVLLGLGLGAALMRRWLLQRQTRNELQALVPVDSSTVVDSSVTATETVAAPAFETAPEIRFAAYLEDGETTIEFTAPSDAPEATLEYSREFHE